MLTAGDFRNGKTFEMDGQVFQVVEFQHVKPGKGAAFVRTKYKNVMTGAVVERSFNPTEKFEEAVIERRDMQYSYDDGDLYHFMDTDTWEETLVSHDTVGDNFKFVKEEMVCKVLSFKGKVFGVEPPMFVDLEVTATEPGVRGDNATNVTKRHAGDRRGHPRAPVYQRGRKDPDRHPHRRISGPFQGIT